jgi:4-hydroxy-3-methylbut-2-enyl diphosphate reductase
LGAIVHNEAELARLEAKGLVPLDPEDLRQMVSAGGETLLIRAHGEPPETYRVAGELGFSVIDCTCPVVLKLQKSIKEAYDRLHSDGRNGQVVIFGKAAHAEVLGLLGQIGGDAVVIEDRAMLDKALAEGQLRTGGPIEIFSQTTKSPTGYVDICNVLSGEVARDGGELVVHDTICSQVASRHSELEDFARNHDVVVFVSGRSSSNGMVLCDLCRQVNIRTYHIGTPGDIRREWFRPDDKVGVCGATSTPKWLLEEVAEKILHFA